MTARMCEGPTGQGYNKGAAQDLGAGQQRSSARSLQIFAPTIVTCRVIKPTSERITGTWHVTRLRRPKGWSGASAATVRMVRADSKDK